MLLISSLCVFMATTVAVVRPEQTLTQVRRRTTTYPNRCNVTDGAIDKQVLYLTDGTGNRRCVTVLTPKVHANASSPMPVLFYFHGAGGNAGHCGMTPDASGVALQDYARRYGFVLVCGEALQDAYGTGGLWAIPEVMTQRSGPRCSPKDTEDNVYMRNVVTRLEQQPSIYDTKRMFTSGCSMGSAFSEFIGQCFYTWYGPSVLSAFATHSTGLKVKNDGLEFPPDNYNKSIGWGDCDACQFFPLVPRKSPGLKACLNDNTDDGVFYRSTKQMERVWKGLGNKVEAHYYPGKHCQIHSWWDIVACLDDNSNRLLPPGATPIPPGTIVNSNSSSGSR